MKSLHDRIARSCPSPNQDSPYCLEVYASPHDSEPLATFYSSRPFPAFHAGDYFRDSSLRSDGWPNDPPTSIARVEHQVWIVAPDGDVRHKVILFLKVGTVRRNSAGRQSGDFQESRAS